ncbi:MAG: FCD domain-containing protein [Oscillospiraceae bacterium]
MKILEYMGILETTPADGTYVKNIASEDLLGKMRFSVSATAVTMMDLLELRISLETFAAYYAAIRRTDEDIEAIRSAIVDMREAKKAPVMNEEAMQNLRYMSYQFHRKIVGAAHNAVLTSVYESLYELLDISQQFTINTSGISYNSILAHETLFDKIVHRDAEGAKRGMSEHLEDVRITLRNSTGEDDEQTL